MAVVLPLCPMSLYRDSRDRLAFTLTELLAVIAIIGVLAAILIPVVGVVRKNAHGSTCRANLRTLHTAVGLYVADWKHYPTYNSENQYDPSTISNGRFFQSLWTQQYITSRYETVDGAKIRTSDSTICPANAENPGTVAYGMRFPNYAYNYRWNGPLGSRAGYRAATVTNQNAILFIDTLANPDGGAVIDPTKNANWSKSTLIVPLGLHGSGSNAVTVGGSVIAVSPETYPNLHDSRYWQPDR
jgi:prepilin-type N-terminal cleavage/methylation domain-containing protein